MHTFKVRNTNDKTLTINNIIKSCNCTDAELSTRTISPGSSANLKLTVKPSQALGGWQVSCTLETDDPKEPDQTFKLTYRSYPRAQFDTSRVDLGLVTRGGTGGPPPANRAEVWFEVYERTSNRADSLGIAEAPAPLTLAVDGAPVVDRFEGRRITRARYRLNVGFDPRPSELEGSSGIHSATVTARSRLGHAASLTAIWLLDQPLQFSPNPVSFGLIKGIGNSVRKEVILRALDGKPYRLLKLEPDTDDVTASSTNDQEASGPTGLVHVVRLTYAARSSRTLYPSGRVRITTDHPRMETVTVPWSAILRD